MTILGLDVGGTHTDAVAIGESGLLAAAKVPTDHDNLLHSIRAAWLRILPAVDPAQVRRINLSTTLSTNAVVQARTEDVGVIVSAGPGLDPENFRTGRDYHVVAGAVDHRGAITRELDRAGLERAVDQCRSHGIKVFAAVTKFSTRNPSQELAIRQAIGPLGDFVTLGHRVSGVLNFPRRVATAYFNSAVWRPYNDFSWAVAESAQEFGFRADLNVLKADGGTMPLAVSHDRPVESILSGPAASVMGVMALSRVAGDALILDVGGTTTDIAVFADGLPVIEKDGMTVGSYPTLVRALLVRSIGVGGDSALHFLDRRVKVGPERLGPALASSEENHHSGRPPIPTLIDALNAMGQAAFGDQAASRAGIEALAGEWGLDPGDLARAAVADAIEQIRAGALDLVSDLNEQPVYTIRELVAGRRIEPREAYLVGGPARVLAGLLAPALALPVIVPEHHAVANAIGAALTRTTTELQLFADTRRGRMFIPTLGLERTVTKTFNLDQAREEARQALTEHLQALAITDLEPEVTEAESFNVVEGGMTTGQNIRVRCQIRPSVEPFPALIEK